MPPHVMRRKQRGPRPDVLPPRYRVKPVPGGIVGLVTKVGISQIAHYAVTSLVFLWVVVAVVVLG
jgi:hypothetical protein